MPAPRKSWRFRKAKRPLWKTEMEITVVIGLIVIAAAIVLLFNALLPPPSVSIQVDPVTYGQANNVTAAQVQGHTGDALRIVVVNASGNKTEKYNPFDTATLAAGTYKVYAYDVNDGRFSNPETLVITKASVQSSLNGPDNFDFDGTGGRLVFSVQSGGNQVDGALLINGTQVATTTGNSSYVTSNAPGTYTVTFESNGTMNYSGFMHTLTFSITPNLMFNVSQNLTSNLDVQGNITITKGVTLVTNGYTIVAGGSIFNYGTISSGYSPSGGSAQKSVNPYIYTNTTGHAYDGMWYPASYGGGGGYGSGCVSNGGSTLAKGGYFKFNGSRCVEYPATSAPSLPALNGTILSLWMINGVGNYTNGAGGGGGEGSPYASGGNGGGGGYGLYIQAMNLYAGNISTQGQPGFNGITGLVGSGGGGGGGGGALLLAYGGSYSNGTYMVSGGAPGTGGINNGFWGGYGANGIVGIYHYASAPVAVCTGVCIGSNHYP